MARKKKSCKELKRKNKLIKLKNVKMSLDRELQLLEVKRESILRMLADVEDQQKSKEEEMVYLCAKIRQLKEELH